MKLEVYKFGGASIVDVGRMRDVAKIIAKSTVTKLVVIISAMGKTTNALEEVWQNFKDPEKYKPLLAAIVEKHQDIARALCPEAGDLDDEILRLSDLSALDHESGSDYLYDQVVSIGELLSSTIIYHYLKAKGTKVKWLDARRAIQTNNTYRDAKLDWKGTESKIKNAVTSLNSEHDVIVSQGFIGSDAEGYTTTLGREGSDYSAAIFAYVLDADRLTIWKDVMGILTADPRRFDNVVKMDRLSYRESIEMAYYGAKVIHPKTIKPLQNKQIPLYVKSFADPGAPGTLISSEIELTYPPIVVIETDQTLLHFATKDFSFIAEEHLAQLFSALDQNRIKVNMMKNTAISFTVCVTNAKRRIERLLSALQEEFGITTDLNLELISIRHYTEEIIDELKKGKVVLMEERAPDTVQLVVKEMPLMKRKG